MKVPPHMDLRRKIHPTQHDVIRELYKSTPLREIARRFGVSSSTIHYILNPDKLKKRREQFDWRKYYTTKKGTKASRRYRKRIRALTSMLST